MEEKEGGKEEGGSFPGYQRIYESTQHWQPTKGLFKKSQWVATEKVHGANFCFVVFEEDGHKGEEKEKEGERIVIKGAKRRELLPEDEDFFGHKMVMAKLRDKIIKIYHLVMQSASPSKRPLRVFIFGEIFGGSYPHPDVAPDPRVSAVQTGIYYSPTIEFYAFDIALDYGGKNAEDYMDYDKVLEIFREADILHAEPLGKGTYEQMLDFPIGFESTIPKKLGLPPLPAGQNKAEGVVIKPLKTIYVQSNKGVVRATLKRKIVEFSEDKKFLEAEKWETKATPSDETPALELLGYEMMALCTENRLNNVISKMGRVHHKETEKVLKLLNNYIEDVMESLRDDNAELLKKLTSEEEKQLKQDLKLEAKRIIREYFKKMLEEEKKSQQT